MSNPTSPAGYPLGCAPYLSLSRLVQPRYVPCITPTIPIPTVCTPLNEQYYLYAIYLLACLPACLVATYSVSRIWEIAAGIKLDISSTSVISWPGRLPEVWPGEIILTTVKPVGSSTMQPFWSAGLLHWCQALHITNKDRYQRTSTRRALALLNSRPF